MGTSRWQARYQQRVERPRPRLSFSMDFSSVSQGCDHPARNKEGDAGSLAAGAEDEVIADDVPMAIRIELAR